MADRFFGLNKGDEGSIVTEGSSTGSTDVELRVNDAVTLNKHQVKKLVEKLLEHIKEYNTTIPNVS